MNLDNLTIGEISLIEDISGLSLSQITKEDAPKGRLLKALVFVISRRQGTPKTLDEIDAMPIDEANSYVAVLEATDTDPL